MTDPETRAQTRCDQCGKGRDARPVMLAMQPGRDGTAWWLCSKCWLEGIGSMHVAKAPAAEVTPLARQVTRKTDPKEDVGDFARPAAKKRRARG